MIMNSVDVVIPVYNAGLTIEKLINALKLSLSEYCEYRIILVDDCSSDDSFERMNACCGTECLVLKLKKNRGQQMATFIGMQQSTADFCVIIDDDFKNSTSDIKALYEDVQKGYDVSYGVSKPSGNTFRNFGSHLRDIVIHRLTGLEKAKKVSSFRIIKHEVVKKVVKADSKYVYISMEILKHTHNIGNIIVDEKSHGKTRYSFRKLVFLIVNLYIYYLPIKWLAKSIDEKIFDDIIIVGDKK